MAVHLAGLARRCSARMLERCSSVVSSNASAAAWGCPRVFCGRPARASRPALFCEARPGVAEGRAAFGRQPSRTGGYVWH